MFACCGLAVVMVFAYIYILALQDNNYYVGSSGHPCKRINQHVENKGSAWTQLHPVQRIVHDGIAVDQAAQYDVENMVTKQLMQQYGIDKVFIIHGYICCMLCIYLLVCMHACSFILHNRCVEVRTAR
jgi:predicted GIY-YIG superfamily endonuclease